MDLSGSCERLTCLHLQRASVWVTVLSKRSCNFFSATQALSWNLLVCRANSYMVLRSPKSIDLWPAQAGIWSPRHRPLESLEGAKTKEPRAKKRDCKSQHSPTSTAIRGFSKTKNFFGEHNGQNVKLPQQAMAHSLMSSFNNIKRWNTKHLNTFGMDGKKKAAVSTLRPATLTWMKYLKISQPP